MDFNAVEAQGHEWSAGYAVAYLHSGRARSNLRLLVSSDDESKVILNGVRVHQKTTAWWSEDGGDVVDNINLNEGMNTLVFKVVNHEGEWRGKIHIYDEFGMPPDGVHISAQR